MATLPRAVTDQDRRLIAAAFHEYDSGQKGYLNREDVKVATVSLFGYKPSKFEVDQVFKNATEVNGEHVVGECPVDWMDALAVMQSLKTHPTAAACLTRSTGTDAGDDRHREEVG
ncbi:EFCAB11 [Branchiostoma lanceolatum]|uniref:EFCAB11 protein n=1 Tax=Branchiostoma lanceolatum TaxID=7740 RepID=A0A8J9ZVJ7_BRALA|nr:EFCAB11 [Branchiostoma lanceolatum]